MSRGSSVVLSFVYVALRRVLGLLVLRGRSQRAKDLELFDPGRTLAYRQRRLLQPSELLQLADAGPRQRARVGLIGARWQLPEP